VFRRRAVGTGHSSAGSTLSRGYDIAPRPWWPLRGAVLANCSSKWLAGDHFEELFGTVARPPQAWWAAKAVRHTDPMGFNPFRPQRRRTSDYAFVAAAFVVTAALLLWAFLPR
jgi:hypothetical protein